MCPLKMGWRGAIEAERVYRLVLPGVRACAPLEEAILHSWVGGLVVHSVGWGCRGRVQTTASGAAQLTLTTGGNYCDRVRVEHLSLCSQVLLLPRGVPPTPAPGTLHTKPFPRQWSLGGAHHH